MPELSSFRGTALRQVLQHELIHALSDGHTCNARSIMSVAGDVDAKCRRSGGRRGSLRRVMPYDVGLVELRSELVDRVAATRAEMGPLEALSGQLTEITGRLEAPEWVIELQRQYTQSGAAPSFPTGREIVR